MWTDRLSQLEAKYTEEVLRALRGIPWASPLTRKVEQHGGVASAPMPLLLELRIAFALHQNGYSPEYEFRTGAGTKSVDFRIQGSLDWLVEVVSLTESDAIKDATQRAGLFSSVILSSLAADPRQSEEGEVVRAIEKIAIKAKKFPIPSPGVFHVILVDMRGYGIGMADRYDYQEIAYGAAAVREECQHYWDGRPVVGLFDRRNTTNSARLVQGRVHFLGFLKERQYCEGEIQGIGRYLHNPSFFSTNEEAAAQADSFPLRPGRKRTFRVPQIL
jgi:hypothetical protein